MWVKIQIKQNGYRLESRRQCNGQSPVRNQLILCIRTGSLLQITKLVQMECLSLRDQLLPLRFQLNMNFKQFQYNLLPFPSPCPSTAPTPRNASASIQTKTFDPRI